MRKTAETNRNITLAAAQIAWLVLVPQASVVPQVVCEIFGGVTHGLWLAAIMWTGSIILTV